MNNPWNPYFGHQNISRWSMNMQPGAYKTYSMLSPQKTHTRTATCEEVDCPQYLLGWKVTLNISTVEGQQMQHIVTHDCVGRYTFSTHWVSKEVVEYTFPAGQRCFRANSHRVPIERAPNFIVTGGDHRGNPSGYRRVHKDVEDWVDDFANNQIKVAEAVQRG